MTSDATPVPSADVDRLDDLSFAIVGPGRVGTSLARWLCARGATVTSVTGRPGGDGSELAAELGAATIELSALASEPTSRSGSAPAPGDELLLLTVPDSALEEIVAELDGRRLPGIVLHTSGRRGAEVLAPLRDGDVAVGSLHPLLAFPRPLPLDAATGAVFGVDGDEEARRLAARIATAFGATAVEVAADQRPLYHLAASVAAGGVVTLVATAARIAALAGVDPTIGPGYRHLAESALHAPSAPTDPGITGPVARGEESYIDQIDRLDEVAPSVATAIVSLARLSLELLDEAGDGLTPEQHRLERRLRERTSTLDPS